ncbi:MAG: group I intron-associated PD-(D/E)XK endonuclease [Nitrososphaerales archaeon]
MAGTQSLQIGAATEIKVAAKLLELGWEVALPLDRNAPYDLVFKQGDVWETIQIKTAYMDAKGNRIVDLRPTRNHRRYTKGDFDHLMCVRNDILYLIPWQKIETYSSNLTLSLSKWQHYIL